MGFRLAAGFVVLAPLIACGDDGAEGTEQPGGGDAGADASACDPSLSYASFGEGFVAKYCAPCHGGDVQGTDRMSAPATVTFDTLALITAQKARMIEQVVERKTMPWPTAKVFPSDAERAQLGAWLRCGPL